MVAFLGAMDPATGEPGASNASTGQQTALVAVLERPIGRPTIYAPALVDRICKVIAGGTTLRALCEQEWAPDHDTLYEWRKRYPEFADALAHARRSCADHLAEACLGLADGVDPDSDYGAARVSKAREQVGVRRWLAGCLDRDTYGDRTQVDARVQVSALVAFVGSTPRAVGGVTPPAAIPHVRPPDAVENEA